jgi:hypothetical protein
VQRAPPDAVVRGPAGDVRACVPLYDSSHEAPIAIGVRPATLGRAYGVRRWLPVARHRGTRPLAELNGRLAASGSPPLPMNRFRPNIVLSGLAAFDEDHIDTLNAGA